MKQVANLLQQKITSKNLTGLMREIIFLTNYRGSDKSLPKT